MNFFEYKNINKILVKKLQRFFLEKKMHKSVNNLSSKFTFIHFTLMAHCMLHAPRVRTINVHCQLLRTLEFLLPGDRV